MRKIEEKMVRACEQVRNWHSGNTEVRVCSDKCCDVYLHGHHIANVKTNGNVSVNVQTLRRWPTPTTKSRLRALGVDVYTRDWTTYLDGEPL